MKKKIIFCALIVVAISMILIVGGCQKSGSFPLSHPAEEIEKIELVKILSYEHTAPFYEYSTTVEVTDTEKFLFEFSELEFKEYIFWSYMSLTEDDIAIKISFENGDIDYIGYYTQSSIISGVEYAGTWVCDEEEFFELIEKYTAEDNE